MVVTSDNVGDLPLIFKPLRILYAVVEREDDKEAE